MQSLFAHPMTRLSAQIILKEDLSVLPNPTMVGNVETLINWQLIDGLTRFKVEGRS